MTTQGHRKTMAFVLIFATILLFTACSSGSNGGIGDSCNNNDDCDSALVCNSLGQCISVECKTAADCSIGKTCSSEYKCVNPVNNGDCSSNVECANFEQCNSDGQCEPRPGYCADIFDCQAGQECVENQCTGGPDGDTETIMDGDTDPDEDLQVDGDQEDSEVSEEDTETVDLPDTDNDGLPDELEDSNGNGEWDEGIETDFNNPDTDADGILDGIEDANQNGRWDLNETDALRTDTDFDKLPDGVEDANQNGVIDLGETDPIDDDTDDDGVIDGNELSNGYFNGASSDPLRKDTDGDTIPDGVEDANGDGIYQPETGETDPTLADSDLDGTPDNEESVATICQEDQVTLVTLHENNDGDWTLAMLPDISYTLLDLAPATGELLYAAAIQDTTNSIAGFILARDLTAADLNEQVANDNALVLDIPRNGVLNHRGRPYETADEYQAMTSHYTIKTANSQSASTLANEILARFSGKAVGDISGFPTNLLASDDEFEVVFETLIRPDSVLVLLTVTTDSLYNNPGTPESRVRMLDITDGTSIRKNQKDTTNGCDPLRGSEPSVVDVVWVVDDSGSMDEDQAAVAAAADSFAAVMTGAGIDFRVGVTSTGCKSACWGGTCTDAGLLGDHGFTSNMDEFKQDVQDPPCGEKEYGLNSGIYALQRALDSTQNENRRFRQDASIVVVFLSDEEDQECEDGNATNVLNSYKPYYEGYEATCFAITGDNPDGCGAATTSSGEGAHEAGACYTEMAYHTGGSFGSICSPDLTPTMQEIVRAAAGAASIYELEYRPITASIQVMIEAVAIPRSAENGFEYDAVSNTVVFYGSFRPEDGDDVVISYKYFKQDSKP